MTALDNRSEAAAREPTTAGSSRRPPARPDDLLLLGTQLGSGYVVPPALVRRGDGQMLQLTPLLYAVLDAVDGARTYDDIAAVVTDTCGRQLVADDVAQLVEGKLRPLGLVCSPDGSVPSLRKVNPLLRLRPRFVVTSPERTRRLTAPFALLFNPILAAAVTVAFALVAFWVLFEKGLASAAYQAFHRPGLLLGVFAVTVVSAGFHEFGHAAALRRGGGTPGVMGAGLYLVWPAFYTDVTDAYRLDRRARVRTDLGGLYFNAIVAVATYLLWLGIRWDALLLVVATQILQMLRQLPPMIRFDGYHLLADLTGVPDLFHRIGPTLRSFLPRRWRRFDVPALKTWVRVVVTAWVLVVVPLLTLATVMAAMALPRLLGTTIHSIDLQAHALRVYAGRHDVLNVLVKALAIVALVIPAGGTIYMLVRVVRRYAMTIWRRTAGKPAQRAVAGVAAAAIVAGLAQLWWPHGNYRPIEPYERGTVADVVPALAPLAGDRVVAGRELTARTVWPASAGALPTADHPALAMVLVPRSGQGPTWVFPFDRPGAPGPGGNQALAVVTRDGGTAYDVAFALVWVNGGTALNRNEAYAFASCRDCRAVAIGFQVVLVVGHADVVAPQNLSAAVSYHCLRCVTEALAAQLVITVPHRLSGSAMRQLTALWRQIEAFGRHLRGLTFAQIRARIASYERQILAIVRPDLTKPGVPSPAPSVSVSSSVTATPGVTDSPTASPPAGASATASVAPTASATGDTGSASASPQPTPSDSLSPSVSPSPSTAGASASP